MSAVSKNRLPNRRSCVIILRFAHKRDFYLREDKRRERERDEMKNIAVTETRNLTFVGHTGSGKTSLVEALLFKMGVNDRLGSVSAGSGMADYNEEEKERKITLYAKPFSGQYKSATGKNHNIVFVDTPGYLDFYGQVMCAVRASDLAVVVVDAVAGVQVGTHRVWKCAEKESAPRAIVVTGLDRENASFSKVLSSIQEIFGDKCVPVALLNGDGKGVTDVLSANIPDDIKDEADASKNLLMERAAETDDELIEKFLGGTALTSEEIETGLKKAIAGGGLVPVFPCMPLKDVGVTEFLEGICKYFPSPLDVSVTDAENVVISSKADDPFVGYVWRTVNDPFMGQLVFVRVLGGTLSVNTEVMNASKKQKERIGTMSLVNGKKQTPTTEASAGEHVALAKLKFTSFSDTLCDAASLRLCKPIVFPTPVMFSAVFAKTQADEDKIGTALQRVAEDDPTIKVTQNVETKELVIAGLGDTHIDVAVARMKSRSNVEVTLATPKIAYRETVTGRGEGHYKHKKQSGGRGQYGEVYLRVQPLPEGDEEAFADAVVGGVIPGNFIPAVEKGVNEGKQSGTLAGYVVTNVKATVYDGSYHDVDSSEIAFKIAGSRAFKEAMKLAKPVLLEPIMKVKVLVPDQYLGDINGDLNHKRGRIMGMGPEDGMQAIEAEVPQAELFRYAAELRSMTGGQGTFEMEFIRYDVVPSVVAQKIIAASPKNKQEEED